MQDITSVSISWFITFAYWTLFPSPSIAYFCSGVDILKTFSLCPNYDDFASFS